MSDATPKESFPQKSSVRWAALLSISITHSPSTNTASSDSALWFNVTGHVLPITHHLTKKYSTFVAKKPCQISGSGFLF